MNTWKDYFFQEGGGPTLLGKIGYIVLIILIIKIGVAVINKVISKSIYTKQTARSSEKGRIVTITELVKKIVKYAGIFIAIILILDTLGISPETILATAGIGSLAIGMGAQSLIKDVINGFFIIVEDQYSVGDLVQIEDLEGVVEELGVRVTKLRAFDGRLFIIPNGEIKIVTNNQRGNMRARIDFPVHRDADPEEVLELMEKTVAPFRDRPDVLRGPDVWGMTENTEEGYKITVVAYAEEGDQYSLERELRKEITTAFRKAGIPGPVRHVQLVPEKEGRKEAADDTGV